MATEFLTAIGASKPQISATSLLHLAVTFKFADGGPSIETPPPRLGQHTDEVLAGLGYSKDDIAKLRAEGAI